MSLKSTIFLTEDDEHCYTDCSLPVYGESNNYLGDEIVLEFDLKNCTIDKSNDTLTIYLNNPNSEIYKKIKSLK